VTAREQPLPPATSRRELRERERAASAATAQPVKAQFVQPTAPQPVKVAPAAARPAVARPASAPRRSFGARVLSASALVAAGALMVGMSLPANVLGVYDPAAADQAPLAASVPVIGQELDIDEADAAALATDRDGFEVKSWAQMLRDKYSRGNYAYSVYWTGAIRWPFPYEVPITDGFGPRPAPCGGCSTMHYAIDMVPGAGTPIYSIADGVVIDHVDGFGSWGNYVRIQHSIDGRKVISSYAHMQTASSPLAIGDTIAVGDFIGLVGSTGQTTAPHLHLEIEDDGVRTDPFIWLTQHTAR
jgi:murein DD-endopeptidase MepM/ murein hydrolase activator NlpD